MHLSKTMRRRTQIHLQLFSSQYLILIAGKTVARTDATINQISIWIFFSADFFFVLRWRCAVVLFKSTEELFEQVQIECKQKKKQSSDERRKMIWAKISGFLVPMKWFCEFLKKKKKCAKNREYKEQHIVVVVLFALILCLYVSLQMLNIKFIDSRWRRYFFFSCVKPIIYTILFYAITYDSTWS